MSALPQSRETFFYKVNLYADYIYDTQDILYIEAPIKVWSFCEHVSSLNMDNTLGAHEQLIDYASSLAIELPEKPLTKTEERGYLIDKLKDKCYLFPFYAYIHSGITISTTPFSCRWDSGMAGFLFAEKEVADAEGITFETFKDIINTYDLYLNEECFGYSIEKWKRYDDGYERYDETVDSCGGFLGYDISENGILDDIDFIKYQIDKKQFLTDFKDGKVKIEY